MNVGENIKRIRKEKGFTQKQLGDKLGISQAAIGQFENSSNIKMDTIKKIATALDVKYTRLVLETPFSSGTREERQKMSDEELAQYLAYQLGNVKSKRTLDEQIKEWEELEQQMEEYQKGVTPENSWKRELQLLEYFRTLNKSGEEKALEQVELLSKIPEYKKDNN